MKNFIKGFLVATLIFAVTAMGFAVSEKQTIEVSLNPFTLMVRDNVVAADHFVYEGTTYVPIKDVAEMLEAEVVWDEENRTIWIYNYEPRITEYLTKYPIPMTFSSEVDEEYKDFLEEIFEEMNDLISYLESINIAGRRISLEEALELDTMRAEIENKFYSRPHHAAYRSAVYSFLKTSDYVESAIFRSCEDTFLIYSEEKIKQELENAKQYNNTMPVIIF